MTAKEKIDYMKRFENLLNSIDSLGFKQSEIVGVIMKGDDNIGFSNFCLPLERAERLLIECSLYLNRSENFKIIPQPPINHFNNDN